MRYANAVYIVVDDAVEAHDRGIKVTLAACLGQYEVKSVSDGGERYLYEVTDSELPAQFLKAYARMGLHENAGGLGIRHWRHYTEPAFVGMIARSWQSSIVPVPGDDSGALMTAFPALEEVLRQAGVAISSTIDIAAKDRRG